MCYLTNEFVMKPAYLYPLFLMCLSGGFLLLKKDTPVMTAGSVKLKVQECVSYATSAWKMHALQYLHWMASALCLLTDQSREEAIGHTT